MTEKKTFRDQLKSVKPAVIKTAFPANASSWLKDGVDHINLVHNGETNLGRWLSIDSSRQWEHPVLGPFRSLNALWYFLKAESKNDQIRTLMGASLKAFVMQHAGGFHQNPIPNFRAAIMHSAYLRIFQIPGVVDELKRSVQPFDCYRVLASGVRIRLDNCVWFCQGYEEIRKALKEERVPDFTYLRSDKEGDLYEGILKMFVAQPSEEAIAEAKKALAEMGAAKKKKKKKPKAKPVDDAQPQAPVLTKIDTDWDARKEVVQEAQVEEPVVEVVEVASVEPVQEVTEVETVTEVVQVASLVSEEDHQALVEDEQASEVTGRYAVEPEVAEPVAMGEVEAEVVEEPSVEQSDVQDSASDKTAVELNQETQQVLSNMGFGGNRVLVDIGDQK